MAKTVEELQAEVDQLNAEKEELESKGSASEAEVQDLKDQIKDKDDQITAFSDEGLTAEQRIEENKKKHEEELKEKNEKIKAFETKELKRGILAKSVKGEDGLNRKLYPDVDMDILTGDTAEEIEKSAKAFQDKINARLTAAGVAADDKLKGDFDKVKGHEHEISPEKIKAEGTAIEEEYQSAKEGKDIEGMIGATIKRNLHKTRKVFASRKDYGK